MARNRAHCILALLCLALLARPTLTLSQSTFIHISEASGLSSLHVTDLFQDQHGFVWVGTSHGLNRFDGYNCVQYVNQPGDTTSLGSNHISLHAFADDAEGNLWVATYRGGLHFFDRKAERFSRYRAQPGRPNSLSMDNLLAVEPDGKGGLWIATAGRGINHFDPQTRQFRVWDADKERPNLLMGSTLTGCLKQDKSGWLWIGTNKGVCRYDPARDTFEHFPFAPGLDRSLSDWYVTAIEQDDRGNIWLGTSHGLNRWDAAKGVFEKYFFASTTASKEPGYDYILKILPDPDGRLWLGTVGGLLRFNPKNGAAERFLHDPEDPFSFPKGPVNAMMRDRDGNVWFGTDKDISIWNSAGESLSHERFSPLRRVFKNIVQTEGINAVQEVGGGFWLATQTGLYRLGESVRKFADGNFSTLFFDKKNRQVLAGTVGDGFYVFDAENLAQIRHIQKSKVGEDADPYTVKGHRINSFATDCQGFMWVAANGCLNRYDPKTGRFRRFHGAEKKLKNPSANTSQHLLSDRQGNLWAATMGGLSRLSRAELSKPFDAPGLRFEHFLHQPGSANSISSDVVFCLLEDSDGHIWAGTDAGLNRLDPASGTWTWFSKTDGLPGNEVVSLVEDQRGDIWVGDAEAGLAKYDKRSGRFSQFSKKDGLSTEQFRPNAGICTPEGFVLMGGRTGLAGFHPDSLLRVKNQPPPLYFTDFKVFNRSVPIGEGRNALTAPIYQTQFIELHDDQNVVSFQFAALDFVNPEKQMYRFRLSPFHRDWQYNGNQRDITFTNLDPGSYTLRVEASENGQDWSGTTLTLRVHPPWYRTARAYLLWLVTLGALLYGIRRYDLRRQLAKAEAMRLQELDAVKTRLYTNITHEFRTPLTVILGEAAQLEKQAGEKQRSGLAAIRRQGRQLLHLVNQMLDLAKVEAGSLRPQWVQGNVTLFLKYLLESFHSLADGKRIELRFETDCDEFWMDYDPDKWQKIVSNLLSNAVKFTPEGGRVTLQVQTGENLRFSVGDTGAGILPEKLPHIFERFYQAQPESDLPESGGDFKSPPDLKSHGSGIGLALTKELVHLLGGQISVESSPGAGARFTVTLPMTRTAEKQTFDSNDFFAENQGVAPEPLVAVTCDSQISLPRFKPNRPRLLLVEDNPDVVRYIVSLLVADYQIYKAGNGQEGVAAALRHTPDLVISDVMMPEMDGFELCRILKTDERTSHIPVVLLTAKADQASKIEGLRYGADAYLAKPFHPDELFVRLEKLIELRCRLQERYARFDNFEKVVKSEPRSLDDLFLQKVVRIVEARMGEEDFDMPQLCAALHMSRSNLFRKIKALTGKPVTALIRSQRLDKARELLQTTEMNVTEVCFAVGFGSPNYFSRAFQEAFGEAPSEVRRRG